MCGLMSFGDLPATPFGSSTWTRALTRCCLPSSSFAFRRRNEDDRCQVVEARTFHPFVRGPTHVGAAKVTSPCCKVARRVPNFLP